MMDVQRLRRLEYKLRLRTPYNHTEDKVRSPLYGIPILVLYSIECIRTYGRMDVWAYGVEEQYSVPRVMC